MNEKPLERLNFYNGERLDAAALKTEQEYHIRTRRWLNKSLYTAGIARGLEVRAVPGMPHVMVSPGLALDSDGREIILLDDAEIEVCSYAGNNDSTVVGNYLVIEYAEDTLEYQSGRCVIRNGGSNARKSMNHWGGPSRIEAKPKFSWVSFIPQPGSNQIVLAQVELSKSDCGSVHQIDSGARRYVGAASAATVRQYALEGFRDIDDRNPGAIRFHIRGRQPTAVTLFLRAEQFPTYFYTQVGRHNHNVSLGSNGNNITGDANPNTLPSHRHAAGTQTDSLIATNSSSTISSDHTHDLTANRQRLNGPATQNSLGFALVDNSAALTIDLPDPLPDIPLGGQGVRDNFLNLVHGEISGGSHYHSILGLTDVQDPNITFPHTHSISMDLAEFPDNPLAVAADIGGQPYSFINDLQISIGAEPNLRPCTLDIQQQLADTVPSVWLDPTSRQPKLLGDGSSGHAIAQQGTGAIRLDFLPNISFTEGEYSIKLSLQGKFDSGGHRIANGGRVHFNLYVE